jgi:hypothetical protein
MALVPRVACPVCGFRFHPKYLERISWYYADPVIFTKPKGYGRGWCVVYRLKDWDSVRDWLGEDVRFIFAVKMLNLLREWISAGVLSKEFVLDALGLTLSFPSSECKEIGLFIDKRLGVSEFDAGEGKEFEFRTNW